MIIRTPKERGYFAVANTTAQDATISFEALGMLTYLLSKPDDWVLQPNDLRKRVNGKAKTTGKHKVYRIIKELISAGYLVKNINREDDGKFNDVEYVVHETAVPVEEREKVDESAPLPENRKTDNPDTEKPDTENQDITKDGVVESTEEIQKKEKDKKITHSKKSKADADDTTAGKAVNDLIAAYLGATKSLDTDIYKKPAQRKVFERIHGAGLTPDDVTKYIASKGTFIPTIYVMQNEIMAWYERNKPAPPAQPVTKKEVSFDPMDDNYDPFAEFDHYAANDPDFITSMRPKVMENSR